MRRSPRRRRLVAGEKIGLLWRRKSQLSSFVNNTFPKVVEWSGSRLRIDRRDDDGCDGLDFRRRQHVPRDQVMHPGGEHGRECGRDIGGQRDVREAPVDLVNVRRCAKAASVAVATLADFERSIRCPHPRTLAAICVALEAAGIEFIAENGGGAGVRLRKL